LRGKGNKVRQCPIWPATAQVLNEYLDRRPSAPDNPGGTPLFNNARGRPLTRFGVRYLLRKYVAAGSYAAACVPRAPAGWRKGKAGPTVRPCSA
jgi:site-specific recombinase XerD